jgi:hypothetical protein
MRRETGTREPQLLFLLTSGNEWRQETEPSLLPPSPVPIPLWPLVSGLVFYAARLNFLLPNSPNRWTSSVASWRARFLA